VMLCSDVIGYQCFGETRFENEGSVVTMYKTTICTYYEVSHYVIFGTVGSHIFMSEGYACLWCGQDCALF